MSYYVMKLYGLVCDVCEASVETVPPPNEPNKLAWSRRTLARSPDNFRYVNGKDICPKVDSAHEEAWAG